MAKSSFLALFCPDFSAGMAKRKEGSAIGAWSSKNDPKIGQKPSRAPAKALNGPKMANSQKWHKREAGRPIGLLPRILGLQKWSLGPLFFFIFEKSKNSIFKNEKNAHFEAPGMRILGQKMKKVNFSFLVPGFAYLDAEIFKFFENLHFQKMRLFRARARGKGQKWFFTFSEKLTFKTVHTFDLTRPRPKMTLKLDPVRSLLLLKKTSEKPEKTRTA